VSAYKSAPHVVRIFQTTCPSSPNMTSQRNTPTPSQAQRREWQEAEDHELVTDSEDDEADATAKFVECERREVARKAAEAEQRRKVEEARAEVQRKKEVRSEYSVRCLVLTQGYVDRHAEPKRLVKQRRQREPRQRARRRRSVRPSWRGSARRQRGGRGSKWCKRHT